MVNKTYINRLIDDLNKTSVTPIVISKRIISILDEKGFFDIPDDSVTKEQYIETHRVLDLHCKSGNLLYICAIKFTRALSSKFSSYSELQYFIWRNLLYAVCPNWKIAYILANKFYRNNIYVEKDKSLLGNFFVAKSDSINNYIPEELNKMKFNVVVGNPPYNNDMFIDFVMLGHSLCKDYSLWITPAKWQTCPDSYKCKSKYSYKDFRDSLLSSISDVVFYPDALDIFNISQVDGISYYLIDKNNKVDFCNVTNKSIHNSTFNSITTRDISKRQSLYNKGADIISSLGSFKSFSPSKMNTSNSYKVITNSQFVISGCGSEARKKCKPGEKSGLFNSDGTIVVLAKPFIDFSVKDGAYICMFSSDNISECESFVSWVSTKFVRFLLLCNVNKLTGIYDDNYWRFVPEPEGFNMVYEDEPLAGYTPNKDGEYIDSNGVLHCSLYAKYNLSNNYRCIINNTVR